MEINKHGFEIGDVVCISNVWDGEHDRFDRIKGFSTNGASQTLLLLEDGGSINYRRAKKDQIRTRNAKINDILTNKTI